MRIQTTRKIIKGKTEKTKRIEREKKSKGPKLCKNYKSTKPFTSGYAKVNLTQLTYGMVDSTELTAISMFGQSSLLDGSWTELVILMLDALMEQYPDNWNKKLIEFNITNSWFCIDTSFGKINFDGSMPQVYKIYNRGLYLEAILSCDNIFNAIVGLSNALGYTLTDVEFNIKTIGYVEAELNYAELSDEETVATIKDIHKYLKPGIHMCSVSILGATEKVHRLDVLLYLFCNWIYVNYGMMQMLSLPSNNSTGICMENNREDRLCQPIQNSMISVYTDNDTKQIIKFIKDAMKHIGMGDDQLLVKFRALKDTSKIKEWEVE